MSISFAATPQSKEAQQARTYTDPSRGAPPSRRSGANAPYIDKDHWNKVFTEPEYFDSIAKQKGMAEGAKVSLFGDDYVYRQAMIGYMSATRGVPLDDMRKVFDVEKDAFAQKNLGKKTASAREMFDWHKAKYERDNEKQAAARQIMEGVIQRSLQDAFSGGDTPFVESVAKDIDAASDYFDDEEKSRLWEKAEELDKQVRATQMQFAPEARFLFDALRQYSGESAGFGAPDMADLAGRLAKLPTNQRRAIMQLAGSFGQLQQVDKGFWYQLAESLGRGTTDFSERIPRNAKEQTLRGNLRLLNSEQPVFKGVGLDGAVAYSAAGQTPLTPEEREQAKQDVEKQLGVLMVQRELRELAETQIDPIKTVTFLPEIVEEGLYGAARSIPYTAAAAIPFAGVPAVAAALYSQFYDQMMVEYPDADPDHVAIVAALGAPISAGLERLKVNTIMGRLPFFGGLVKRFQHPNQRNIVRIAIGGAGVLAEQNAQEILQNATFPFVQMIGSALDKDIPEYNLDLASMPRDLAVQFVALLPLSLMGIGALSYREISRGEAYLRSKDNLEKAGYSEEQIDRITGAATADEAQSILREESTKRDPKLVKAAVERIVNDAVALREQTNPDVLPRLEKQGADYVVLSPEGRELARTTDQTAAEQALVSARRETVQREMRDVHNGINFAMDWIRRVSEARNRGEDITELIREVSGRTLFTDYEANPSKDNLNRLFETARFFGGDPKEPEDLKMFPVIGSNQGALREGIWRSIIRINDGADGVIVMREFAQDNLKRAVAEGRVTMDWVRQQLNDILPQIESDRIQRRLRTETDTDVIEAFSDVAVAYFRGQIREEQIPEGLRGFFRRMAIIVGDIFRRAYNLARLRAEGKLDRDFEALLAEAVGVDQQALVDRARERTEQEVGAQQNYSIGLPAGTEVRWQQMQPNDIEGEDRLDATSTWSQNTNDDADNLFYGELTKDGNVVGRIMLGVNEGGIASELDKIWIDDSMRRQGAATKLLYAAMQEAGVSIVYAPHLTKEGGRWWSSIAREIPDPESGDIVERIVFEPSNYSIGISPTMDADYLAAVERGDMETAQRMVDEAARRAGYDVGTVYHGTNRNFNKFSKEVFANFNNAQKKLGFFFTPEKDYAQQYGGRVINAYLRGNFKEESRSLIDEIETDWTNQKAGSYVARLKREGFDGVIFDGATKEIAVFNPNQIKSADPVTYDAKGNVIPLSQRFDQTTANINYSIGSRAVLSEIDRVLDMPENPPSVPTAAQEGGKVRSIAKLFHAIMDGDSIDYGSLDEDGMTERVSQAGDRILDVLLRASYEFPNFASWYESRLKMALAIFQQLDPDVAKPDNQAALLVTLAITSNGADVATQTEDGWDVYNHWKQTGRLAGAAEKRDALRGAETENKLTIADKMADALGGYAKLGEFLNRKGTVAELRKAMAEQLGGTFTKEEITRLTNGELIDEVVPFSLIFGPKLGSFFNNMSGDFSTITMDRWFMRTFGRTMGTQLVAIAKDVMAKKDARLKQALKGYKGDILKRAKIEKGVKDPRQIAEALGKFFQKAENRKNLTEQENDIRLAANDLFKVADGFVLKEAPDSGTHRRWIRAVMTDALNKFNSQTGKQLVPAEAQALLWYYEKLIHDTLGSRQKDASPDYASAANKLFIRERGTGSDRFSDSDGIKRRSEGRRSAAFGGVSSSGQSGAAAVDNYSIATQSEIDRVQKAMDRLARSPSERIAQYAALKERLAAALERNQPIMQSMRGDTLPQDFDRTRLLNDLGFLDYILKVLPPEVRGRVGGYTNLAAIAPVDVYKGDQKVSEAKNPAGAIISAWMREGLNIGQAQKKTELPEGYSTVANTTDERRDKTIANFLIDRLKKIDRELERYYKRDLMERIFDVLDKSRPKAGDSGVKRSTLGPETQKFADMVYRASLLDDEETAKRLAAIEGEITSIEAKDEGNESGDDGQKLLSQLSEEWTIVNTFGDLKSRPSETLAYGLEWLQGQLKAGREAWNIKEAARIQENRERAAKVIAFLGKPTDIGRFKNKSALQRFLQATNAFDLDHKSFEQFAFWLFGDEVSAELSAKMQRAQINDAKAELENTRMILAAMRQGAKSAGMTTGKALAAFKENKTNAVRKLEGRKVKDTKISIDLAKKIVRGLADRGSLSKADVETLADELAALPRDTKKEFVTIKQVIFRGEEVRLTMSRAQAMQLWLTWQQTDAQEKMRRDGFTDDSFEDIDNLISDPFSQAILRVTQRIYGSGYALTNPIYARMFGMNMPMVRNYAPARYLSSKQVKDIGLDGTALTAGGQPSFAKSRVNHTAKLAPEDALVVLQSHLAQQSHWVAFAEVTREYRSLLANPEVREAIRQRLGEDVLRTADMWGDQMEQRGGNKGREIALINNALGAVIGGQSVSLLGLNLKSLAMQTDNLMRFFLALNSRQIASALGDPAGLLRAIRKVWKTDIIQTRLQGGATAETRFLFNRFVSMFRRGAKISELAMLPMNYADSAGLSISGAIVYQAAYKDAVDSGMDERSAEKAANEAVESMVFRYGQPVLMGQKSNIENSGGVFAKTFFLFMSDPRLKMAIIADSVRGLATGRGNWTDHVRRIVAIELMALVAHVLATGFRDLTSDDEDEDLWSMGGFARALLLAPFQGYFFLGSVSDLVLSRLTEAKWFMPTQDPFIRTANTAVRAVNNLDDAFNFDDPDALVKEWTDITRSIALTPPLAAPAVIMNLVRPLVQGWERMDDDE